MSKKLTVKEILDSRGLKKLTEIYTHTPLEAEACENGSPADKIGFAIKIKPCLTFSPALFQIVGCRFADSRDKVTPAFYLQLIERAGTARPVRTHLGNQRFRIVLLVAKYLCPGEP